MERILNTSTFQAVSMFAQQIEPNRIATMLNVSIEELSQIVSKYITFM